MKLPHRCQRDGCRAEATEALVVFTAPNQAGQVLLCSNHAIELELRCEQLRQLKLRKPGLH
jgi:hypothetical protein